MPDNTLPTVFRIVAEVSGAPIDDLREDTHLSELNLVPEDYHDILEECCEECDVPINLILSTMPVYRYGAGEYTMSSLRNLAAFSAKASALLEMYDVNEHVDTIGSLAESLRQKRYVPSAFFWPRNQPARTKRYVLLWSVGLFVAAFVLPYIFVRLECGVICMIDSNWVWSRTQYLLRFSVSIAILINLVAFVPGLLELRSRRALRKLKGLGR